MNSFTRVSSGSPRQLHAVACTLWVWTIAATSGRAAYTAMCTRHSLDGSCFPSTTSPIWESETTSLSLMSS